MSRSASTQFTVLSLGEAKRLLATAPPTADTHGDRLAAQRVVEFHESSALERAGKPLGRGGTHHPRVHRRVRR